MKKIAADRGEDSTTNRLCLKESGKLELFSYGSTYQSHFVIKNLNGYNTFVHSGGGCTQAFSDNEQTQPSRDTVILPTLFAVDHCRMVLEFYLHQNTRAERKNKRPRMM